jgi:hypothetical protein
MPLQFLDDFPATVHVYIVVPLHDMLASIDSGIPVEPLHKHQQNVA